MRTEMPEQPRTSLEDSIKQVVTDQFNTLLACQRFETRKPEKILINLKDSAAALGISVTQLNKYRYSGQVHFRQVMGKVVISQSDLESFAMRLYEEAEMR